MATTELHPLERRLVLLSHLLHQCAAPRSFSNCESNKSSSVSSCKPKSTAIDSVPWTNLRVTVGRGNQAIVIYSSLLGRGQYISKPIFALLSAMVEGKRADRLGNLPDHILLTILDRLSNVREAARTSVLSTRWRQLPAVLSRLRINVWDFLPAGASTCQGDEIVQSNASVVEATQSILGRRDSSRNTIQFLCIKFFLRDDAISIGHAVGHTMATHKVEIAEFIVFTEKDNIYCNDDDLVNYGRQFMSLFDACPDAFGGLTRLHLENLRFGESDISNVLNTCGRLKHLRLFNCDSGSCTRLQVEHSQLSELAIVDCSFESVVLSSLPKLTRMAFEGWISFQEPINFGYVPLLEAVGLTNVGLSWHKMVKLSTFLGDISVRDLKLGFDSEKIWVQPEHLTKRLSYVFRQLRFVNLVEIPEGYDLTWTLFILEAAPNLKELYMTVWDHLCKMDTDPDERRELLYSEEKGVDWESSQSNFRHHNLATLTMFGFQLEDYMVNYVRRVIKAAVELQDAFLYIRLACGKCHTKPRKPYSFPFIEMQQTMVKERITDGIDSSARIHFLTGGVIRADHQAKMDYP